MSKKATLTISTIYFLYFCSVFLLDFFCNSSACRVHDDSFLGWIFFLFLPLLPVFVLSLITYKLPDQVFQAWWKFAVWFVPLIIALTTFADMRLSGGGGWGIPDMTEAFVHIPLYILFIGISFARIYIAWREVKTNQPMTLIKKVLLTLLTPVFVVVSLWLIVVMA